MSKLVLCAVPAVLWLASAACAGEFKEFLAEGFSVRMPGTPKPFVQKKDKFTVRMYVLPAKEGAYIVVALDAKLPAGADAKEIEARLDNGRDQAVHSTGGKLLKERRIRLAEKYPGRELEVGVKDRILLSRFYLIEGQLFNVMVEGTESFARSPDALKFLDSFRWTK